MTNDFRERMGRALAQYYEQHKNSTNEVVDANILDEVCRMSPNQLAASFLYTNGMSIDAFREWLD